MRYRRILAAVAAQPWAMESRKLAAMLEFLVFQAAGGKFERAEIDAKIAPAKARSIASSPGAVAVVPIFGVISQRMDMMADISGGTSADATANAVRQAAADEAVKAIILDVDSPGGDVHGIQEAAAAIYESRELKPIVAQVNSTAASAAYWLASQASEIVVTPSGEAGSIGVLTVRDDLSAMLEEAGIKRNLITDGKHKGENLPFLPMGEDERAHLAQRVSEYGDQFRADVARGRGVAVKTVAEEFGGGRMFGAKELLKRGMVDRLGTMAETLARFVGDGKGPGAKRAGLAAMRAAFGAGGLPTLPTLESGLCEAGATRSQARAIAAHGLPWLIRCEAEQPLEATAAADSQAVLAILRTPFGQLKAKD